MGQLIRPWLNWFLNVHNVRKKIHQLKRCISDKISHLNSVTESSNSKRRKFYFLIFVIGNVVEKERKEMSKTALFTIFDLKITLLCNYCTKKQKSDQKVLNKKKIKMLFFLSLWKRPRLAQNFFAKFELPSGVSI